MGFEKTAQLILSGHFTKEEIFSISKSTSLVNSLIKYIAKAKLLKIDPAPALHQIFEAYQKQQTPKRKVPKRPKQHSTLKQLRLLAVVHENPTFSAEEISLAAEMSYRRTRDVLTEFTRLGFLQKTGKRGATYQITAEGKIELQKRYRTKLQYDSTNEISKIQISKNVRQAQEQQKELVKQGFYPRVAAAAIKMIPCCNIQKALLQTKKKFASAEKGEKFGAYLYKILFRETAWIDRAAGIARKVLSECSENLQGVFAASVAVLECEKKIWHCANRIAKAKVVSPTVIHWNVGKFLKHQARI